MLEGTSINGIPSSETDHISGLPSFKLARKGGRGVKLAVSRVLEWQCWHLLTLRNPQCVNCRNVGKRCDPGRPCSRCKRLGLRGCTDAPSKAKRTAARRIAAGPAPDDPQSTASTSMTAMHQGEQYEALLVAPFSVLIMPQRLLLNQTQSTQPRRPVLPFLNRRMRAPTFGILLRVLGTL